MRSAGNTVSDSTNVLNPTPVFLSAWNAFVFLSWIDSDTKPERRLFHTRPDLLNLMTSTLWFSRYCINIISISKSAADGLCDESSQQNERKAGNAEEGEQRRGAARSLSLFLSLQRNAKYRTAERRNPRDHDTSAVLQLQLLHLMHYNSTALFEG